MHILLVISDQQCLAFLFHIKYNHQHDNRGLFIRTEVDTDSRSGEVSINVSRVTDLNPVEKVGKNHDLKISL